MSAVVICERPDRCPEHGPFVWFCRPCHNAWAERPL